MRKENLLKHKEGFTIVEVMIVLAIAALIILIIFLAVPALQRNSRNQQRNNDVSLIGAAITECLNARNGLVGQCNTVTLLAPYFDMSKVREINQIQVSPEIPSDMTTVHVAFARKCTPDNSAQTQENAASRSTVLLFNTEGASGGEVSRCQEVQG